MIKVTGYDYAMQVQVSFVLVPTFFPAGTSQVWKLPEDLFSATSILIHWNFSEEREIFHLAQLMDLIRTVNPNTRVVLDVPFFPYGRQDKDISNESTFARSTFLKYLLSLGFDQIHTLDVHSVAPGVTSREPKAAIDGTFKMIEQNYGPIVATCFPDVSAWNRYNRLFDPWVSDSLIALVIVKDREASTGEITSVKLDPRSIWQNKVVEFSAITGNILIVDDICDGGRTFVEAAKLLRNACPEAKIHLYTTHGIYSKGLDVLFDAGITTVSNHKGMQSR